MSLCQKLCLLTFNMFLRPWHLNCLLWVFFSTDTVLCRCLMWHITACCLTYVGMSPRLTFLLSVLPVSRCLSGIIWCMPLVCRRGRGRSYFSPHRVAGTNKEICDKWPRNDPLKPAQLLINFHLHHQMIRGGWDTIQNRAVRKQRWGNCFGPTGPFKDYSGNYTLSFLIRKPQFWTSQNCTIQYKVYESSNW